jgi:hypothetical protein
MRYPFSMFLSAVIMVACTSASRGVQDRGKNDSAALAHLADTVHPGPLQITVPLQADTLSEWQKFITLFRDTTADTLQLFMYEAWIERINEDVHYSISKEKYAENLVFKGKLIDETLLKFIQPGDIELQYNQSISYYAVNRIVLDSNYTYLTVRLYSDAAPHIIDFLYLYVFDKNYRLLDKILVADLVGDDGFSENMQSWVTDLNRDGIKEIVTRTESTTYDGDQEEKTTSFTVRHFTNGKFVEVSPIDNSMFKKKFSLRDNGAVYH